MFVWASKFNFETWSAYSYFYLICLGLSGPYFFGKIINPIWNKVTPIKDRPTHIESYICYLASVFVAVAITLPVLALADTSIALRFAAIVTLSILPFALVFWYLKASLYPMSSLPDQIADDEINTSDSFNAQSNVVACLGSGITSALVFNILIMPILLLRGGIEMIAIPLSLFIPMVILNALLAPVFLYIGSKLWTKSDSIALKYISGAAIGLFFLMATSVCRPNIEMTLEGFLSQWSLLLIFGIAIISHFFGGVVAAKLYKQPKKECVFR